MTSREPLAGSDRLTPVPPQTTLPPDDHALHDRLLVVRYASHEQLDPAETVAVRALVDSCPACASLMGDIGTIARATAYSQSPRRPRDFRLSPQQAEQLRGSWLHRLLGRFDGPSTQLLRPLAGAVLAIGLVLTVVGTSLPGISSTNAPVTDVPARGSAVGSAPDGGAELQTSSGASSGPEAQVQFQRIASPNVVGPNVFPSVGPYTVSHPGPTIGFMAVLPSTGTDVRMASPTAEASVAPDIADVRVVASPSATPKAVGQSYVLTQAPGQPVSILALLGFLLAIVGGITLILIWFARRSSRDSLLR